MKVCFIMPYYSFPVPSISGGAVEELMTLLIDENEKNKNFEFTFLSPCFDNAKTTQLKNLKLKKTNLVFFKNNKISIFGAKVLNKIARIFKLKSKYGNNYEKKTLRFVNDNSFDKIIFEGAYPNNYKKYSKKISKDKIYFHLHSYIKNKENIFDTIGNLISVSQFILDDWIDWCKNNNCLSNMKGDVLLNAVNESKFNKKLNSVAELKLKKELGFDNNDFIVLFCGRILQIKGVLELMESVVSLNHNNIKLLIVGSPNFSLNTRSKYLNNVVNLVKSNENKIKFTGYVRHDEVYKFYQLADVLVVPSLCNDAAPLVVIEGLFSGRPQIVTKMGGIPEYISKSGAVVIGKDQNLIDNIKKSIINLYNDKNLCKNMGEKNLLHSKNFNQSNFYENFKNLMEL